MECQQLPQLHHLNFELVLWEIFLQISNHSHSLLKWYCRLVTEGIASNSHTWIQPTGRSSISYEIVTLGVFFSLACLQACDFLFWAFCVVERIYTAVVTCVLRFLHVGPTIAHFAVRSLFEHQYDCACYLLITKDRAPLQFNGDLVQVEHTDLPSMFRRSWALYFIVVLCFWF